MIQLFQNRFSVSIILSTIRHSLNSEEFWLKMLFVFPLFAQEFKYLLQLWKSCFKSGVTAVLIKFTAASDAFINVKPVTQGQICMCM